MIPVPLLGLGVLVAALVALSRRARAATPAAAVRPDLHATAQKIVATGNPTKIAAAARAAHAAGNPELAKQLATHARGAYFAHPSAQYPSPFPTVPAPAWSAWVHLLRVPSPTTITPTYHLGLFGFGMRRLVDLKLATNPHKRAFNGRQVWDADWIPELQPGPESFLSRPELQYQTFIRAVKADAAAIKKHAPNAIGADIDGVAATLSGLLAVAKQAGVAGLVQWLTDAATRAKYPTTTALFHRANGAF